MSSGNGKELNDWSLDFAELFLLWWRTLEPFDAEYCRCFWRMARRRKASFICSLLSGDVSVTCHDNNDTAGVHTNISRSKSIFFTSSDRIGSDRIGSDLI